MENLTKELNDRNDLFEKQYSDLMNQYYQKAVTSKETMESLRQGGPIDAEGGKIIIGTPAICIKTANDNGVKVFINILHHEDIAAPKDEFLIEMENNYGVRVPLSLSEAREDFDKSGSPCQVYDVIFNSFVTEKIATDGRAIQFVLTLILQRIHERFKQLLKIDKSIVMKNMKYKGSTVLPQRVRVKKGPKIEEIINRKDVGMDNEGAKRMATTERSNKPEWNLFLVDKTVFSVEDAVKVFKESEGLLRRRKVKENDRNERIDFLLDFNGFNQSEGCGLMYLISLPIVSRSKSVVVTQEKLGWTLECAQIYKLALRFPREILGEAQSYFDTKSRSLIVFFQAKQHKKEVKQVKEIEFEHESLFEVIN